MRGEYPRAGGPTHNVNASRVDVFFSSPQEEEENDELGFTKIGGVFVVLVLGCLIAFMFSILEFLWNIRKVAIEEEVRRKRH